MCTNWLTDVYKVVNGVWQIVIDENKDEGNRKFLGDDNKKRAPIQHRLEHSRAVEREKNKQKRNAEVLRFAQNDDLKKTHDLASAITAAIDYGSN